MALVESQIGTDYCTNGGAFLLKPPRIGTLFQWHQDSRAWFREPATWFPEETPRLSDTWIAFDESTEENGCLQLLPGSEKYGILPSRGSGDRDLGHGFGDDPASMGLSESDTVHCVMELGDVAVWHQDMSHYSQLNRSSKPRLGLSLSQCQHLSLFSLHSDTATNLPRSPLPTQAILIISPLYSILRGLLPFCALLFARLRSSRPSNMLVVIINLSYHAH